MSPVLFYVIPALLAAAFMCSRGRGSPQAALAVRSRMSVPVFYVGDIPTAVHYREGASVCLVATVRVGSRHEVAQRHGVSHLLEHLLFKGTQRYPRASDLSKAMNRVGAVFNAFTSQEQTSYYCKIPAKFGQVGFRIISQMMCCPRLRPEDVKMERGVVVEEIRKYRDAPERRVRELACQRLYSGHALGVDIAGSEAEVMNQHFCKECAQKRTRTKGCPACRNMEEKGMTTRASWPRKSSEV